MKTCRLIRTAAWLAGVALAASAADRTWVSTGGGNWYTASNWSPSGPPDPADNLTFSDGQAYMSTPFTVSNRLTFTKGGLQGFLTIASSGVLYLADTNTKSFCGVLTNAGQVQFSGTGTIGRRFGIVGMCGYSSPGTVNTVGALFELQGDQSLYGTAGMGGTAWFTNAGTLRKSGGGGLSEVGESSAALAFRNGGTAEAFSGTLRFQNYTEAPTATLAVALGGTTTNDYGRLAFLNAATFLGQFTVSTRNGFRPNPGDTFEVLTYPSATVGFVCLNGLDLGGGILLVPEFKPTKLTLTATAYTPGPLPQLFVSRDPGGVRITWPLGFSSWKLLSTTNLTSPIWVELPVQCGNQALVPWSGPVAFFRLVR
jgi:hypothetical protein